MQPELRDVAQPMISYAQGGSRLQRLPGAAQHAVHGTRVQGCQGEHNEHGVHRAICTTRLLSPCCTAKGFAAAIVGLHTCLRHIHLHLLALLHMV